MGGGLSAFEKPFAISLRQESGDGDNGSLEIDHEREATPVDSKIEKVPIVTMKASTRARARAMRKVKLPSRRGEGR